MKLVSLDAGPPAVRFTSGRHEGKPIGLVYLLEPRYVRWALGAWIAEPVKSALAQFARELRT